MANEDDGVDGDNEVDGDDEGHDYDEDDKDPEAPFHSDYLSLSRVFQF